MRLGSSHKEMVRGMSLLAKTKSLNLLLYVSKYNIYILIYKPSAHSNPKWPPLHERYTPLDVTLLNFYNLY